MVERQGDHMDTILRLTLFVCVSIYSKSSVCPCENEHVPIRVADFVHFPQSIVEHVNNKSLINH